MIPFQRLTLAQKEVYENYLFHSDPKGCEYSFANLYLWGRQQVAFLHGCVAFFSHFDGRSIYPYPIGNGDRRAVLEEILQDAKERGIPCRIASMTDSDARELEEWFPGKFLIRPSRDSFDYIYAIDDLADLKGRKYQKKRNHVNKFRTQNPDYRLVPLDSCNLEKARVMVDSWFYHRVRSDPEHSYLLENLAMARAFQHYNALGMEGCLLMAGEEVVGVTMATRLRSDTMDIHFEKAREDLDGAYAAINCEFANYLRAKHPEIRFLNREDDVGLEGLRKAKLSYLPHHMGEKYCSYQMEDLHDI